MVAEEACEVALRAEAEIAADGGQAVVGVDDGFYRQLHAQQIEINVWCHSGGAFEQPVEMRPRQPGLPRQRIHVMRGPRRDPDDLHGPPDTPIEAVTIAVDVGQTA